MECTRGCWRVTVWWYQPTSSLMCISENCMWTRTVSDELMTGRAVGLYSPNNQAISCSSSDAGRAFTPKIKRSTKEAYNSWSVEVAWANLQWEARRERSGEQVVTSFSCGGDKSHVTAFGDWHCRCCEAPHRHARDVAISSWRRPVDEQRSDVVWWRQQAHSMNCVEEQKSRKLQKVIKKLSFCFTVINLMLKTPENSWKTESMLVEAWLGKLWCERRQWSHLSTLLNTNSF